METYESSFTNSDKLPIVASSHQAEEEAETALKDILRGRFLVRRELHDYGIDGSIEILKTFGDVQVASNQRAYYQLKSADRPHPLSDGSMGYRIETKNIFYLGRSPLAFYILFIVETKELFFAWWQDVVHYLDSTRPQWQEQETTTIKFLRRLDTELIREIQTEIEIRSEQIWALRDGPNFVRHFSGTRQIIRAAEPFIGRDHELQTLESHLTFGAVVGVIGPPNSGKTQLMAHFLKCPQRIRRISAASGSLALLLVDPLSRIGPRSFLRSLSFSLGMNKRNLFDGDTLESDTEHDLINQIIGEELPLRLQNSSPILIVENYHECIINADDNDDLDRLIASDLFRSGMVVVLSRVKRVPNGRGRRFVQPEIELHGLSEHQAASIIAEFLPDKIAIATALAEAIEMEVPLLPGVLLHAGFAFQRALHEGRSVNSDDLLECLLYAHSSDIRQSLRELERRIAVNKTSTPTVVALFLAMAIVRKYDVPKEAFEYCGLTSSNIDVVLTSYWIEESNEGYKLTESMVPAFRIEGRRALETENGSTAVANAIFLLLEFWELHLTEVNNDRFADAVEDALAWTIKEVPNLTSLHRRFRQALIPLSIGDAVLPFSREEALDLTEEDETKTVNADFVASIAGAVVGMRFELDFTRFYAFFERAAIIITTNPICTHHLRALDYLAFEAVRLFGLRQELLATRIAVAETLQDRSTRPKDAGLSKWLVSWALNTGSLAASMGRNEETSKRATQARNLLREQLELDTSHTSIDWMWLEARLLTLEAMSKQDARSRVELLGNATDIAARTLMASGGEARWIKFYLRSVRRLLEEESRADTRVASIERAIDIVSQAVGEEAFWTLDLKCQIASLYRGIGELSPDYESALEWATKSLYLLNSDLEKIHDLARGGYCKPLMVLSRCYAFKASCHQSLMNESDQKDALEAAYKLTLIALNREPTAGAWNLSLQLLDQIDKLDTALASDNETAPSLPDKIRTEIAKCRKWVQSLGAVDEKTGRLLLWCLQREWRSAGNLERVATSRLQDESYWETLTKRQKQEILRQTHEDRERKLKKIERSSGLFLELFIARARNEAQLQRLLAVYGDRKMNTAPVLKHFEDAKKSLPNSAALAAEQGQLFRYFWRYEEALSFYRQALTSIPGGKRRREIMSEMVELLLRCIGNSGSLSFIQREDALEEAQHYVSELIGFRHIAFDIAILRDRVRLESGADLDWTPIDNAYDLVVGDVGRYINTVIGNLSEIGRNASITPIHLADLVRENCTHPRALAGMGNLYLRRAELGRSPDLVLDCRKAFATFQACSVLERAWGRELPTTSYHMAQAALLAARASRSLNPFGLTLDSGKSLIGFAISRAQRAASNSIEQFHVEARELVSSLTKLNNELAPGATRHK